MASQKRCPNGQRRNPKTGKCEKHNAVNKCPHCPACMMTGRGRRPKHVCVRNENGKLIKKRTSSEPKKGFQYSTKLSNKFGKSIYVKKSQPNPTLQYFDSKVRSLH